MQPLPASLTNHPARMNDRIKHKPMTGQAKYLTADHRTNASVLLFFATTHFFKTILASCTNGTFGFVPAHKLTLRKTKRAIFCQRFK